VQQQQANQQLWGEPEQLAGAPRVYFPPPPDLPPQLHTLLAPRGGGAEFTF
jgi:hypothetical protein